MFYVDLNFKLYPDIEERDIYLLCLCVNDIMKEEYYYSDKEHELGVHLYFPDILVNKETHKEKLIDLNNKVNAIFPHIPNIVDVAAINGIKLMYQGPNPYRLNVKKSMAIDDDFNNKFHHLRLTQINQV